MTSENAGQYAAQLTVLFSARTLTGPLGDPTIDGIDPHFSKEQHDAYLKDGFPFSKEYTVDAATKLVRLIVADRVTDLIGSVTIPIAPAK